MAKDSGEPEAVEGGLLERSLFKPIRGAQAAVNGERMAWVSEYFLPGSEYSRAGLAGSSSPGLDYLSTRGPEGWSTEATVPPQSPENGLVCFYLPGIVGWSSNLNRGILADGDAQEIGSDEQAFQNQGFGCGHAEPALREADGTAIEEPEGFQNLFLRDSDSRSYQLVNVTPPTAPKPAPKEINGFQLYYGPSFLAGSADLSNVVFEDELPLTEAAERLTPAVQAACKEVPKGRACWEGHDDLYVWNEGQQPAVRLVTVLPDGEPVEGTLAGSTRDSTGAANVVGYRHAISADGARIFFEAEGNLYVRENGGQPQSALGPKDECTEPAMACTIQLDLPQGGKGTGGGGQWLAANAEGTKVFFSDQASTGLTATTVENSGVNLYEYELPSEADTAGTLVDLTPASKAEVLGVSGVSENGSYAYFVAEGALTGEREGERNSHGDSAQAGLPNLYVIHRGETKFIAALNGATDNCDWALDTECETNVGGFPGLSARVSANGTFLAFDSVSQLTGYDNMGPACAPDLNTHGYGAPGSCEEIFLYEAEGSQLACVSCNPNGSPSAEGATIDWPAPPDTDNEVRDTYPQRNVSEGGAVFFETSEALLPQQDTNGVRDVYEYERGTLHLISSGRSSAPSYFADATPSGNDVFFVTAQKLLPDDDDAGYALYDARVGGGFSEPPRPASPCESEGCKGAAGAPTLFSAPSSTIFAGPGNIVQAKRPAKPKPKKTAKQKRKAKLQRELRACARRYRHNGHQRRQCKQHARRRLSQKARAGVRDHKEVGR